MKICYLANAQSPHTQKWAIHFAKIGYDVHIISFREGKIPNITIHNLDIREVSYIGELAKLRYLFKIYKLKRLIHDINPDILHAHYASSYGFLGALLKYHPYIISMWGSDVFNFPQKSFIHKKILEFSFKKADYICSTSHIMKKEAQKYTDKEIIVTTFGIDCEKFRPTNNGNNDNKIIIGTIKSLEKIYGIEYLIKAFSLIVKKYPEKELRLLIVGEGSIRKRLEDLAESLNVNNLTEFIGSVPNDSVPNYLNKLSVFVNVSKSEGFGVAVLEASACGIPVIVSNVGGLLEVVDDGMTGFIVPSKNPKAIARAIEKIILNEGVRERMGRMGREFVLENFKWNKNAKIMEHLYKKIVKNSK